MKMRQAVMKTILAEGRNEVALSPNEMEWGTLRKQWLKQAKAGPKGTPARIMRQMCFQAIMHKARQYTNGD